MGLSTRTKTDVNVDDVAKTSDDMTAMFKWKFGQKLYGTQARASSAKNGYVRDIQKMYGKNSTLKTKYIDTTKPIGEQLKKLK